MTERRKGGLEGLFVPDGGGTPRYSSIWRRITGSKGRDPRTPLPVVVLENDRPEYYLSGEARPWAGAASLTAGVGNNARIQVFNPANSGVISVVTSLRASFEAVAASFVLNGIIGDTALTTNTTGINIADTRSGVISGISSQRLVTTQLRTADTAPGGVTSSIYSFRIPVGFLDIPLEVLTRPLVLGPGSGIFVSHGTTNALLSLTAEGYERALESGEEGPL